jgi:hypothetical protein
MGVSRPPSDIPIEALGIVLAYREARPKIVADAKDLKRRAEQFGMLDEVLRILSPPEERRRRGRQWGSHSSQLTENNEKLGKAYEGEKAKTPDATDDQIVDRLIDQGRTFGKSKDPDSVKRRLGKIKQKRGEANRPKSLLETAGPRKIGRPKKER